VGAYFCGCYFRGYELHPHVFVDSAIRDYNQYKEIWEASYGEVHMREKRNFLILLLF